MLGGAPVSPPCLGKRGGLAQASRGAPATAIAARAVRERRASRFLIPSLRIRGGDQPYSAWIGKLGLDCFRFKAAIKSKVKPRSAIPANTKVSRPPPSAQPPAATLPSDGQCAVVSAETPINPAPVKPRPERYVPIRSVRRNGGEPKPITIREITASPIIPPSRISQKEAIPNIKEMAK